MIFAIGFASFIDALETSMMDLGFNAIFLEYNFRSILIASVFLMCFTVYCFFKHRNYVADLDYKHKTHVAVLRHEGKNV